MPNLARRLSDALDQATGNQVPARVERATRYEVAVVQGRAIVQAARTQAVEYVAHSALRAVEGLTDMESWRSSATRSVSSAIERSSTRPRRT